MRRIFNIWLKEQKPSKFILTHPAEATTSFNLWVGSALLYDKRRFTFFAFTKKHTIKKWLAISN